MIRNRRTLTALATLAGALLAFTVASPAALAMKRATGRHGRTSAGTAPGPDRLGWRHARLADRPDRGRGRPGRRRRCPATGPRAGGAQGTRHHRLTHGPTWPGRKPGKSAARPGHHYPGPMSYDLRAPRRCPREHVSAIKRPPYRQTPLHAATRQGRARLQVIQLGCRLCYLGGTAGLVHTKSGPRQSAKWPPARWFKR